MLVCLPLFFFSFQASREDSGRHRLASPGPFRGQQKTPLPSSPTRLLIRQGVMFPCPVDDQHPLRSPPRLPRGQAPSLSQPPFPPLLLFSSSQRGSPPPFFFFSLSSLRASAISTLFTLVFFCARGYERFSFLRAGLSICSFLNLAARLCFFPARGARVVRRRDAFIVSLFRFVKRRARTSFRTKGCWRFFPPAHTRARGVRFEPPDLSPSSFAISSGLPFH